MSKLIKPQRHTTILELLQHRGAVSLNELTRRLGVSTMTVRRDLDELEEQGLLKRTHGGATTAAPPTTDPSFAQRAQIHQPVKNAIAAYAAALVDSGDRLILDSGSTVAAVCPHLAARSDLTVISYSMPVIQNLIHQPDLHLISTGGAFDPTINALVGPLAQCVLEEVRVDKAFLSATSVQVEEGFSNSHLEIKTLQQTVLRIARKNYLLVDSSKFLRPPFWLVAPLEQVTAIITDEAISPELLEQFSQAGATVLVTPTKASNRSESGQEKTE